MQPEQPAQFEQSQYDSSLESLSTPLAQNVTTTTPIAPRQSLLKFSRRSVVIASAATLLVLLIGASSLLFTNTSSRKQAAATSASYAVGTLAVTPITDAMQSLQIGTVDHLDINGELTVTNTVIVAPTAQPTKPTAGQIYYDQTTNQPYYYNGTAFVSLAPGVASLGGAKGAITVGNGLQLADGQLTLSAATQALLSAAAANTATTPTPTATTTGVTSFQGQTGAVNLAGGTGISINGTTITNSGVTSLVSASSNVTITQGANGAYTLSGNVIGGSGATGQVALFTGGTTLAGSILSQSGTTVTTGGNLTVTGALSTNTIQQTAAGNNISVTAGNDAITFVAGGITFSFPTTGGSSQTICTTGISCAAGGGQAVVLNPSSPQTDSGTGSSIAVNNTGGGNLLQLQSNGVDGFVVNNGGAITVGSIDYSQVTNRPANLVNTVTGTANQVNASSSTGNVVLSLPQDIAAASSPTFNGLSLNGGLSVVGATTLGGSLNVAGTSTFQSNISVQGGNVIIGTTGVNGTLQLTNSTNSNLTSIVGLAPTGVGTATIQIPSIAGGASDQVCLLGLANCAGAGSGVTASASSAGYIPVFSAAQNVSNSILYQTGTTVGINTTTPGAYALNVQGGNVNFSGSATVGSGLNVTGASSFNGAVAVTAANSFTVGTGATSLGGSLGVAGATTLSSTLTANGSSTFNGSVAVSGINTLTVGTGATTLGGALSVSGQASFTGNISQTGNVTFSTGTGAVSLNGDTTIASGKNFSQAGTGTFSTGSGAVSLNGNTAVTGTLGASGDITGAGNLNVTGTSNLNGGASVTGTTNINTTGTAATTIGNSSAAFSIASTGLTVSAAGATSGITTLAVSGAISGATTGNTINGLIISSGNLTGVTGLSTSGGYTQTGVGANTFSGATTFTGAGTALTVNNSATITGTANIGTLSVGSGGISDAGALTVSGTSTSSVAGQLNLTGASIGLNVTNDATIGGTLAIQGSNALTVGTAGTNTGSVGFANSTNSYLGLLQAAAPNTTSTTGNATYILPSIAAGSTDTVCLSGLNNCGGSASTVTTSTDGTANTLAKFTGAHTVANSTITDDGTTVTIGALLSAATISTTTIQSTGAMTITPGGNLTIGATNQITAIQGNASSTFAVSANGFTTTLGFTAPTGISKTITLPDATGTVCLQNSAACGFAFAGSGVTSITGTAGGSVAAANAITFNDASTTATSITINNASTTVKGIAQFNSSDFIASGGTIDTIQGITTTSSVQFGSLTLGAAGDLTLSSTGKVNTNNITGVGGVDVTFDAVANAFVFKTASGANSFVFPTMGGLGQVICTSGITCATGGGQAVVLEPSAVQTASSNRTALFINKSAGTGNLLQLQSGGSDALIIDASGNTTISNIATITDLHTNSITPTAALSVGSTSQAFTLQGTSGSTITGTNGTFTTSVGYVFGSAGTAPTGNVNYQFQNDSSVAPGSYNVCTTAGNCAGVGGGVTTAGGTANKLAKFTGAGSIADSIITDGGTGVVTIGGSLTVGTSGSAALTLGVASTTSGTLVFNNATNSFTQTFTPSTTNAANTSIQLPNASGTIAVGATGPIVLDALTGQISCTTCLTSGGGGSGGVSSITGTAGGSVAANGALTFNDVLTTGTSITINNASTTVKGIASFNATNFSASAGAINTIQDINSTASPTFGNLALQGTTGLSIGSASNIGQLSFYDGTADGFKAAFSPATLTANRLITIPNNGGTLAVAGSGNIALSATGVITTINNPTFSTSVTTPSLLSSGALSITSAGQLSIGVNSQTLALIGSTSSTIAVTNAGFTATVGFTAPTAARSITFPDATGTVCLQSSASCGFALSSNVVNSVNGLNGALTIANASAAGATITINDATTASKGIASFNATNFSVTAGAVNTIQDIATTATPSFAGATIGTTGLIDNGPATFNGNINVTGTSTVTVGAGGINTATLSTGSLSVSGATTLSGGTNINTTSGAGPTNIGNNTGSLQILSSGLKVTSSGATSGITTLTLSGAISGATSGNTINGLVINSGALSGITGYAQASGNFAQAGTGTFSTATGQVNLNGNTAVTGTGSFSVGTGTTALGGALTVAGTGSFASQLNAGSANQFQVNSTGNVTSGTINGQTISSTANFTGSVAIQGASGLTLGVASTTDGLVTFANALSSNTVSIQAANPSYVGNVALSIPSVSTATDEICLKTTANCTGTGGSVAATGYSANYVTKFTGTTNQITASQLFDNGSFVGVNTTTSNGQLSVVAAGTGSAFYAQGAATGASPVAVIKSGGSTADLLQLQSSAGVTLASFDSTGNLTVPSINATSTIKTAGTTRIDASGNLSNIGTIGASGNITTSADVQGANVNATGTIQTGGTTRIDSAGNITGTSLQIAGGTGIVGQFSGRVLGGDAVNSNEFTTLGQVSSLGAGNYIQNQTGSEQAANYTIKGVGSSATAIIRQSDTNGSNPSFIVQNAAATTNYLAVNWDGTVDVATALRVGGANSSGTQLTGGQLKVIAKGGKDQLQLLSGNGNTTYTKFDQYGQLTTYGTNNTLAPLAVPTGVSATPAGSSFYYVVTAINAQGQTLPSAEVSSGAGATVNFTSVLGATSYRVYRGTTSGTYTGYVTVTTNSLAGADTASLTAGTPPTTTTGTGLTLQGWDGQTAATQVIQAGAGQTGKLLSLRNSAGTAVAGVDVNGFISSGTASIDGKVSVDVNSSTAALMNVGGGAGLKLITSGGAVTTISLPTYNASGFRLCVSGNSSCTDRTALNIASTGSAQFYNNANSTSAFQLQDSAYASYLTADALNGRLAVGKNATAPAYTLDVQGGTGIVGQFSGRVIGGDAVNSNEFATLGQINSLGAGNYIQNQSATPQSANFYIQSAAVGTVGGIIQAASGQTADLLQFRNSSGLATGAINANGTLSFQPRDLTSNAAVFSTSGSAGAGAAALVLAAGTSANSALLLDARDYNGVTQASIDSVGNITGQIGYFSTINASVGLTLKAGASNASVSIGKTASANNIALEVQAQSFNFYGQVIEGVAGQTADLLQVRNSSATVLTSISATGDVVLGAGQSLKVTGSTTFPSSPTEGQVYYRTDNKQLYVYANGKWQADRSSTTAIVSASNTQNKEKADFVGNGTNDDVAINAAIASLPATGGSVVLLDGTYNITAPIAMNKANVNLTGQGSSTVLKRMYAAADTTDGIIQITVDNLAISNLKIDGNSGVYTGSGNSAITSGSGRNYITLSGLAIANNASYGINTQYNILGTAGNGRGWVIKNNNITNSGIAVQFDRTSGVIDSNTITNSSYGINTQYGANGVQISNNVITGNSTAAINGNQDRATITGNYVDANTTLGITNGGSYSTISDNHVVNGTNGIRANGNNVTVSGNEVSGSTAYAIYAQGSSGLYSGNTLSGGNDGFFVTGNNISFKNNQIINVGGKAVNLNGAYDVFTLNTIQSTVTTAPIYVSSGRVYNTISNNTYSGPATTVVQDNGTSTIINNQQDANGNINFRGSAGIGLNTTAPTSSLQNAGGFINSALSTPSSPTVTTAGTAGTTSYTYAVTAYDGIGETLPSAGTVIATGNAILDGTNYNIITPARVSGAVSYKIYRTASGGTPATTGYIGTLAGGATTFSFKDTGLAASGSAPVANTTGSASIATYLGINNVNPGNRLSVNTATTTDSSATVLIGTNGDTSKGLVIQGTAAQSASLFQTQRSDGAALFQIAANGDVNAKYINLTGSSFAATGSFIGTRSNNYAAVGNHLIVGGFGSYISGATLGAKISGSTDDGLVVQAAASQTGSLVKLLDSAGTTTLTSFGADGQLTLGTTTGTQQGYVRLADGTGDGFNGQLNTATLTASQSYTLPNASGTICVIGSTSCAANGSGYIQNQSAGYQAGEFSIQGVNNAVTTATIKAASGAGSNNIFAVVNDSGSTVFKVSNGGLTSADNVIVAGSSGGSGRLRVSSGASSTPAIQIQASAGQTANLLQIRDSTLATTYSGFNATGQLFNNNSGFTGTIAQGTLTANRTYTFPDATGTVCIVGAASCGASATGAIANSTTLQSSANFNIQSVNATSVGGIIGGAAGQTADLFQLQNSGGAVLSNFDASGNLLVGSFAAPVQNNPTTSTTGGSFAAGTYYYKIVAQDAGDALSAASNEKSITTTGSTSTVTLNWNTVPGAYTYRVYRGTSAGAENVYFYASSATSVTDTGGAGTAGTPPTTNSAASVRSNTNGTISALHYITGLNSIDLNATGIYSNASITVHSGNAIAFSTYNGISIGGGTGTNVALKVGPSAANVVGQYITGYSGQTADLLQLQDNNGLANAAFSALGNQLTLGHIAASGVVTQGKLALGDGTTDNFGLTLQGSTLTANRTYTFPDSTSSSDTICLQTLANCGVTTVGALDGGTANANGATIAGTTIFLQSASSTNAGLVNTVAQTFTGVKNFNNNVSLVGGASVEAGATIRFVGGITSTRPASPTPGMLYYDTTTNTMLQYNGSKWVSDRSTSTKIVAASNSSQAIKDSADYIATGTDDQTTINAALTAAAGGSVYLAEGTYIVTGSIPIPNNTTLTGSGSGTVIKVKDALNTNIGVLTALDGTTGKGINISHIAFDGNKANQTSGNASAISLVESAGGGNIDDANISSVEIYNFNSSAIYFEVVQNSSIRNSYIHDNGEGIYAYFAGDNINIEGNSLLRNTYGVLMYQPSYTQISNNNVRGGSYGVTLEDSQHTTVSNNVIAGTTVYGVYLYGAKNGIVNSNKINDIGGSASNNGIYLENSSFNNSISDNTVSDTSCTTTCYAINISDTGSTANYLSNNRLGSPATINDAAPNTIYANQVDANGNLINRNQGAVTIGTTTASKTLTIQGSLSASQLPIPAAPTLTTTGTTGAVTRAYAVTALDGSGETLASTPASITTTNTTLSTSNYVNVNYVQVGGAVQYKIYRTTGGGTNATTTGLIGTVAGNIFTFKDTGFVASGTTPAANTTGNATVAGQVQGGSLNVTGNSNLGGTLAVSGAATFSGALSVNGGQFTNNGATLNTAAAIANLATGGAIGTAAATVDVKTTFNVTQTTAGQTLSLPSPTATTAGRIVYVSNVGTASFVMHSITIAAGANQNFIWNGAAWAAANAASAGGTTYTTAALDTVANSGQGIGISGSTIFLQSASGANAGVVNTTTQTFSGDKTFNGNVTTKSVTNSANAFLVQNLSSNTVLGVDTSTGSVLIGSAGTVGGKLVVAGATSGAVTLQTAAVAGSFTLTLPSTVGSANDCLKNSATAGVLAFGACGGGSTHSKSIVVNPEYPNSVLSPSGSSNTGFMTSNYVSGLTSGEGYKHNYYDWSTDQATAQSYDIVSQYQLPSDFSSFTASSWKLWAKVTNTNAATALTWTLKDAVGTTCVSAQSITLGTTWAQTTLTDPTGGSCTFAADDTITIDVNVSATTAATAPHVQIGDFRYGYTSAY